MVLIGHNGSGKSTLIQYLLGFYNHPSQHPFLEHFSQKIDPLDVKHIGYTPEIALLDNNLNANDYGKLIAGLRYVKDYNLKTLMDSVSLNVSPSSPLKSYSKGMKQRLLLALALLGEPELIVLDEPTSGLDPFGQEVIEALLIKLKKTKNIDFILCTHSLRLAYALNEEIWILKEGKIVYQGKPNSLDDLIKLFDSYKPERLQ